MGIQKHILVDFFVPIFLDAFGCQKAVLVICKYVNILIIDPYVSHSIRLLANGKSVHVLIQMAGTLAAQQSAPRHLFPKKIFKSCL